jgi:hypothetical protein
MASQKIIVAFLVTSALVLSVMLIVLPQHPQTASASMSSIGRDYILLTSDETGSGSEFINVIDTRALKMVVYQVQGDKITPLNIANLNNAFIVPK